MIKCFISWLFVINQYFTIHSQRNDELRGHNGRLRLHSFFYYRAINSIFEYCSLFFPLCIPIALLFLFP